AKKRTSTQIFRKRKKHPVDDLEARLAELEKNSANVIEENERLKLQLHKTSIVNELLKETSTPSYCGGSEFISNSGPGGYSPTDFYTKVLSAHGNQSPSHRIVISDAGERFLAAGATWDYISAHPLFKQGLVDVGDVSERLKGVAKCDGLGPVFEEKEIINAIMKSVEAGRYELL
ncbi:hypothetical protein OIDMADRAFT_128523, partial [Oidiodendron maius Zn]